LNIHLKSAHASVAEVMEFVVFDGFDSNKLNVNMFRWFRPLNHVVVASRVSAAQY